MVMRCCKKVGGLIPKLGQAFRNELHRITVFDPAEKGQGRTGIDDPLQIEALVGNLPIKLLALAETLHCAIQIIQRLPQGNGQGVDGSAEQVDLVVPGHFDAGGKIPLLDPAAARRPPAPLAR